MDGSYGHPARHAQSPITPQTPSTSAYQVNVARRKTRKWVEAKVQNYDGDDWGADEFEEESDSEAAPAPPPQPPHVPSVLRTYSGTELPSSRPATFNPNHPSGLGGFHPSRVQTLPVSQNQPIGVTSPVVSDLSVRSSSEHSTPDYLVSPQSEITSPGRGITGLDSNLSFAAASRPPSQTQYPVPSSRDVSRSTSFDRQSKPTPPPAADSLRSLQSAQPSGYAGDGSRPLVRLSQVYHPMDEDKDQKPSAAANDVFVADDGDQFAPPPKLLSEQDRRDTWERDDDSESGEPEHRPHIPIEAGTASEGTGPSWVSTSSEHPDFVRISTSGSDFFRASPNDHSKQTSILEHKASSSTNSLGLKGQLENQPDRRSASSTPAVDSPAAISQNYMKDITQPESGRQATIPSLNQEVTSTIANQQNAQTRANPQSSAIELEEEDSTEAPGGAPLRPPSLQQGGLHPGRGFPSIPPLRTPSPHEPRNAVPVLESESAKITPTEPLQPRKVGDPATELELRLLQREPAFSTATSSPMKDSPLKESDVLSDEIMRTLSPGGATPGELRLADNAQLLSPASRSAARESSYTLSDYDSYWADATDKPGSVDKKGVLAPASASPITPSDVEALSSIPQSSTSGPKPIPLTSLGSQKTFEGILSPQQSQPPSQQPQQQPPVQQPKARRRFSWEAEDREPVSEPQQSQPPADGSATPTLRLVAPPEQQVAPPVTDLGNRSRSHSPASQVSQALEPATGSGAVSPQVSGTNSPARETSSLSEVPSPAYISVPSDGGTPTTREQARLSLADEKFLAEQTSTNLVTGSPQPENHPALSSPALTASTDGPQGSSPLAQTKTMTLREIMSSGTAAERIAKYNETRRIFAARDSGLDNWLVTLSTQHPEHAFTASTSYGSSSQTPTQSGSSALPVGSQPPTQQPYYQQYLNASAPSAATSQSSRSRLGGLSVPSQISGSAFGHSGGQLGTKSKEFMHSAGKMGKGLLSKGKSKLRGSGDKDDPNSPVHPVPNKSDRRTSWRFNWDPKSREDEPAPHANEEIAASHPTPPPQLPSPSPVSPWIPSDSAFPWTVPPEAPDAEVLTPKQPGPEPDGPDGPDADEPRGKSLLTQGEKSNNAVDDLAPDDWVIVSHHSDGRHPDMATPCAPDSSRKATAPTAAEDSGVRLQSQTSQVQTETNSDLPKRASSFIGLPPIRRSSTFGMTSRARRATERFSLEEDDESNFHVNIPPSPASEDGPSMPLTEGPVIGPHSEDRNASAQDNGRRAEASMAQQEPIQNHQLQQPQNQPGQIQTLDSNRQQYAGNPVPLQMPMHPFHKVPPAGPWKLEESHLSEPLHLTKKRSGTDFSQQGMYHGYEKELGLEIPTGSMAPPPQPNIPGRLRSDVPPSSAHRYPELFSQDPRQWSRGPPHPQQFQSRASQEEFTMSRGQRNEDAVPTDERGRKKRSSGLFKDIGTRIARATSRERRGSLADSQPPSLNPRGDGFSDASGVTEDFPERRKKRSSLLGFSSRRSSIEQGPRRRDSITSQQSQRDSTPSDTQPQTRERKHSLLSIAQQNSNQNELTRSSTSSLAPGSSSGVGVENQGGTATQKKRLSGFTGLFSRSRQERGAMNASGSGHSGQRAGQVDLESSGRGRSGTPGSFRMKRTESPADTSGRRSRQGSSSGFISGILGHRSSSKSRDQPLAHNFQSQQQQLQHQFLHSQLGAPIPQPGGHVHAVAPQAVPPVPLEVSRQRAASMGFPRSPPQLAMRQVSEPLSPHPQPSPLGLEKPMTHGDPQTGRESIDSMQPSPVVQTRRPSSIEHFETPPEHLSGSEVDPGSVKVQSVALEQKLTSLQDTESDDAARGEAEILRPLTVSPDVSVDSNRRIEERGLANVQDVGKEKEEKEENEEEEEKEEDTAKLLPVVHKPGEGSQTPGAFLHAPSPQSFPSVLSLHDQLESNAQREANKAQSARDSTPISPEPSPQVARSVLSEEPVPSISKQLPPLETTKSQEQHRPGSRAPSQGQQLPDMTGQQAHSTEGREIVVNAMAQEPRNQPPPVTVANASVSSIPVFKPGEFETPRNVVPAPLGSQSQPTDTTSYKESQGSRWKGLKNRVSEQIAQKPQPQQSPNQVGMGEKVKASKLLGAFKRGSKQAESAQSQMNSQLAQSNWQRPPPPGQQLYFQGHQPRLGPAQIPLPNSPLSGHYPPLPVLPPPSQQPYFQGQQPRIGLPQSSLPHSPLASHYPPSAMPPPNMVRVQTMPPGPTQGIDTPYGHHGQAEPQYAQVPIPRGYSAVHGEGVSVPSPYRKSGQPSSGQFSPPPQPFTTQRWHGQQHPAAPGPFQRQASTISQEMVHRQHTGLSSSSQVSHFRGASDSSLGHLHSPAPSPASQGAQLSQQDILQRQMSQSDRRESQQSRPSQQSGPGMGVVVAAPQQVPSETSGRNGVVESSTSSGTTSEGPRSTTSRSPGISVRGDEEGTNNVNQEKQTSSLGLDAAGAALQPIGDGVHGTTLQVPQNKTGESDRPSMVSQVTSDENIGGAGANGGPKSTAPAELEDTEEVRLRAIRLEAQDEKILYEPEDEPKMSATSYPGQEWNPFGEAEYGDWREE